MKNNPFPYSDDHKRYHTWNYYLRHTYHSKVFKVPLDAGMTCPNRDGTCGYGGCTYCTATGSGEFAGQRSDDLMSQFLAGKKRMKAKWNGMAMPYFQAFTNTYAPLPVIKQMLTPFMGVDEIPAICIATRSDCLEADKIAYLHQCAQAKDIWIELGLQSVHDETARVIHRGHTFDQFYDCIQRLSKTKLHICVHLINGLPTEDEAKMIESVQVLSTLPIHAIKIHMLHIMKNTEMARQYEQNSFPLLSLDEYVNIVIQQLEILPPEIIIQRLSGDGAQCDLIAPRWSANKKVVLNTIDKEMIRRNTWQGRRYTASL